MPPKPKEDKTSIKGFKDGSSNWWCNDSHYHLNEAGELIWCSGGMDTEELRNAVLSFISRNKKTYKERSPSIFETEERVWSVLDFGKHKGLALDIIKDIEPKYLRWIYENSEDKKLVQEIKELLKIK